MNIGKVAQPRSYCTSESSISSSHDRRPRVVFEDEYAQSHGDLKSDQPLSASTAWDPSIGRLTADDAQRAATGAFAHSPCRPSLTSSSTPRTPVAHISQAATTTGGWDGCLAVFQRTRHGRFPRCSLECRAFKQSGNRIPRPDLSLHLLTTWCIYYAWAVSRGSNVDVI